MPNSELPYPFGQTIVWQPDPETIAGSNLAAMWQRHGLPDYDALLEWATDDIGRFWEAVLLDLDIRFYEPYSRVIDTSTGVERPVWCVDGVLNIVHNLLDKWQETEVAARDALRYESEEGDGVVWTYRELGEQVRICAAGLRSLGLKKGDAVGLYMPMTPELIVAFLATAKIGGIIIPLFSGYGPQAVAGRLSDANARALFVSDGLMRRGRAVPLKPLADAALNDCPSVEHVFVHERVGQERLGAAIDLVPGRDRSWNDLMARGRENDAAGADGTERTSAEDPLMLIYTSGTTGRPKGAVHTHCGFPIKAAQDMRHPMDLKPGEVMWWMTDMGWMMGPWLVFGTLLNGATMVLYDGAPDFPDVDRTWQLCADHGVSHLGVSPTLIRALRPHGAEPIRTHDLSTLRAVGSTGSPWDPESWRWLFENVLESKKPILNYSGGTEISGGIVCGTFVTPLKPGSFSGPVVGMDADVLDEHGQPIRGAVGEIVVRQPWIGMTRGFWKDEERYVESYWRRFPGVWTHGDFAAIDGDGLWYILGRSDDTIKVAGKRLGPAEVEAVLNAHPAVVESAAVGVPHEMKGQEVVAFCVLGNEPAGEALRKELMERVARALGKPLRPREIRFVRALPKTRNAKVMRRLIRAAYLGEDLGDTSSLEHPETLDAIRDSS
jgi:acetyl-CoA synthetase